MFTSGNVPTELALSFEGKLGRKCFLGPEGKTFGLEKKIKICQINPWMPPLSLEGK
jgi:hypothetical protein